MRIKRRAISTAAENHRVYRRHQRSRARQSNKISNARKSSSIGAIMQARVIMAEAEISAPNGAAANRKAAANERRAHQIMASKWGMTRIAGGRRGDISAHRSIILQRQPHIKHLRRRNRIYKRHFEVRNQARKQARKQ